MKNKKVSIEEILEHYEFRKRINSIPISEIEFVENFEKYRKVEIDPKIIEEWVYTGLNNFDFITTGFYKTGFDEVTELS